MGPHWPLCTHRFSTALSCSLNPLAPFMPCSDRSVKPRVVLSTIGAAARRACRTGSRRAIWDSAGMASMGVSGWQVGSRVQTYAVTRLLYTRSGKLCASPTALNHQPQLFHWTCIPTDKRGAGGWVL